uniref:Uncharacterized protein n=1 Tax=Leersia perrieri TaxID=77586 RepID=A0A0D9WF11_9ORYZ
MAWFPDQELDVKFESRSSIFVLPVSPHRFPRTPLATVRPVKERGDGLGNAFFSASPAAFFSAAAFVRVFPRLGGTTTGLDQLLLPHHNGQTLQRHQLLCDEAAAAAIYPLRTRDEHGTAHVHVHRLVPKSNTLNSSPSMTHSSVIGTECMGFPIFVFDCQQGAEGKSANYEQIIKMRNQILRRRSQFCTLRRIVNYRA